MPYVSVMQQSVQEIVDELYRLYRLRDEGKKVDDLIERLEERLERICEDNVDNEAKQA